MDQIGRYKILEELGRGAMGVVYRAQDPAIGRVVAIKTIRLNELADPSEQTKLRDRLMREAQSAGILSHPGIVTIFDVAEENGTAYIAMECIDGPTLERLLISDPPDAKLILEILAQTAAALDYAHKRGIVHRDIKPANIMIHERTTAKIADFGVARIQSQQMTQAGAMVGTPNYMSPEQIQGQPVDGRADQFSLAVIAYELLTGEKPFAGDSIPALAFKIVQEDAAPAHRLNPTLGWPVDIVLKRGLSKNPADRYPTCSDFVVAIENAIRPSKGWKPATPASLQSLPTVGPLGAASINVAPSSARPPHSASRQTSQPVIATPVLLAEGNDLTEEPSTPVALRWARKLALAIVGAALIGAVIFGALQWMENEPEVPTAAVKDETVDTPESLSRRPSPIQEKDPEPRATVTAPTTTQTPPPASNGGTEEPNQSAENSAASGLLASPVRLVTNPPSARIVVDGNEGLACTSPCSLDLNRGRHTLAATLDGYRRTLKIFEAPGEGTIFLNLDRTVGNVIVRSDPRGATLIVDGQPRSEKTPVMLTLPTGRHTIDVVQDKQKESHEVVVRESVIANLSVSF